MKIKLYTVTNLGITERDSLEMYKTWQDPEKLWNFDSWRGGNQQFTNPDTFSFGESQFGFVNNVDTDKMFPKCWCIGWLYFVKFLFGEFLLIWRCDHCQWRELIVYTNLKDLVCRKDDSKENANHNLRVFFNTSNCVGNLRMFKGIWV